MSITESLEAFDLNVTSKVRLAQSMNDVHFGELESIVKTMTRDEIPYHENSRVNNAILRYAIMGAFENNRDSITSEDLQSAHDRAVTLITRNGTLAESSFNEDAPQHTLEPSSDAPQPTAKRKRNPNLYPSIRRMVEASPDAEKDTIVQQAMDKYGAEDGTATNYYYKARKELGLKNNGKRGRKSSNLYPMILELVKNNLDKSRKELVALAVEEDVKPATANVYVGKALKELE